MPIREHDFARIGLFAELPGEQLRKLGERMRREQVPMGATVLREGDDGERFYVVLSGMLNVTQEALGERRTLTPSVVASCDKETFDELIRPLFSD